MIKSTRLLVYKKYNGHCAYCGKLMEYKEMQIDHLMPQRLCYYYGDTDNKDDISNLMPSCRRCNNYKRAHDLETFRGLINKLISKISETYLCKVAIDYGVVQFHDWDGKFYYEKKQ